MTLSNLGYDSGGALIVYIGKGVVNLVMVAAIDGGGGPTKGGEFGCEVAKFYSA